MARIRRSDEVDRAAIAEIHQHLVALGGRNHQALDLHGLREKPAVTADNEERPPVGEAQIEGAGVRRIQQAQAHDPRRYARRGADDPIHDQSVALEAMHDVHHVGPVHDLAVAAKPLVLQHDRQVVDAIGRGQPAIAVGTVADDHHAGEARVDLRGSLPVRVRMEPVRACGLLDRDLRRPHRSRPDRVVRAAVDVGRHQHPVPMQRRLLIEPVLDAERDGVAVADTHDRTQVAGRDAP